MKTVSRIVDVSTVHLGVTKDVRPAHLAGRRSAPTPAGALHWPRPLDFATTTADIVGLYLVPPRHAEVFGLDGEDRRSGAGPQVLRIAALIGSRQRHGFRVRVHAVRHALALHHDEHPDRKVVGTTMALPRPRNFSALTERFLLTRAPDREVRLILKNLVRHKTNTVAALLDEHRSATLRFTPTYSSRLKRLKAVAPGRAREHAVTVHLHIDAGHPARKLRRYGPTYAKHAKPVSPEVRQLGEVARRGARFPTERIRRVPFELARRIPKHAGASLAHVDNRMTNGPDQGHPQPVAGPRIASLRLLVARFASQCYTDETWK